MKTPKDYNAILREIDFRFITAEHIEEQEHAARLYRYAKNRAIREGAALRHPWNL